jgi:hypothetical protein
VRLHHARESSNPSKDQLEPVFERVFELAGAQEEAHAQGLIWVDNQSEDVGLELPSVRDAKKLHRPAIVGLVQWAHNAAAEHKIFCHELGP